MTSSTYILLRKWHFRGGLFTLPFVIILAVTGLVYLCKDYYEAPTRNGMEVIAPGSAAPLSLEAQLALARQAWTRPIQAVVLSPLADRATEFVSGRFGGKASLFVDPYAGRVTGERVVNQQDMYRVRKLHGELLTGGFGTKIVELVGSWLVVLILTGLFLFFPRGPAGWKRFFRLDRRAPRPVFWRQLHGLLGFWCSAVLLIILAGGLPWTDVWGGGFKWVQAQTGTGYPPVWRGKGLSSTPTGDTLSLDAAARYARSLGLPGEITITLPQGPTGIYQIHNTYHTDHSRQGAIHLDRYTGWELARVKWSAVGVLMRGRMWAMAFHQGQLGTWNWTLVFGVTLLLLLLSLAAAVAYRKGPVSKAGSRKLDYPPGLVGLLVVLGVLLPLFGLSVLLILGYEEIAERRILTSNRWPK